MMVKLETSKLLSIAKDAVMAAGEFLSKEEFSSRKVNKEFKHDLKIEADVQSEKIIIDCLEKQTDFSILSEERGMIKRKDLDYCWIVDPVDGSVNYSRGIPLCCVSIGLWKGKEPLLGIVYDFNRSELFSGIVGEGTWLNGTQVFVSKTEKKQKAILLTGFPVKTDFSTQGVNDFIERAQSYRKVRFIGSAALSIAYVAAGRADVYSERDIMLWDVAGGIPLVISAGGKVDFEDTARAQCLNVHAFNGHIA